MPFFDIPKPLVKALVTGPKKKANKLAGAVTKGLVQRANWEKLARVRSKAGATKNSEGTQGEEDVVSMQLPPQSPEVRRVASSPCLQEEEIEGSRRSEGKEDDGASTEWSSEMHNIEGLRRWSVVDDTIRSAGYHMCDSPPSEGSEGSDSEETAAHTEGTVTPANNLSRSNSYKIAEVGVVDDSSPLDTDYSIRSSPRRTVVDPYGVRLVQKARTDTRRYDRALALPSFRPVHPALAFDDEGF